MRPAGSHLLEDPGGLAVTYDSYTPNPRQQQFHGIKRWAGFNHLVKGAVGGLRAGKSACCMQELIDIGMRCPGGTSIAVRQSMPKAEASLVEDMHQFLRGRAVWKASSNSFYLPGGHRVLLAPADEWDRFGSTQFVAAYIMEAQEVKPRIFDTLLERLSHPAGMQSGVPWYRLLFDARGVPSKHWINEYFKAAAWDLDKGPEAREKAKRPWWVYTRFRTSDNVSNLRPGYLEELREMHKNDPGWIAMMLEGEIGYDLEGRPVFGSAFDPDVHVASIECDRSLPLLRSWDWGYNSPAVAWMQFTREGRLYVLREFCPKEISRDQFLDQALAIQETEFPGRTSWTCRDFCDIAGDQADTTGITDMEYAEARLSTAFEGLRKAPVENGLDVIRALMRKQSKIEGKMRPHFLLDESCVTLREAMAGMYYYESLPTGPRIKKGQGYDDICDSVRFCAQAVAGEADIGREEEFGRATTYAAY